MIRYPYHRYLKCLLLGGHNATQTVRHIQELGFRPPRLEDVQELRTWLTKGRLIDDAWREKCDVLFFDQESEDMLMCWWVVNNEGPRAEACKMLRDVISSRNTAKVLSIRFQHKISEGAIALFRKGWWDTDSMTSLDWLEFEQSHGEPRRPRSKVPLETAPAYNAWQEGLVPDESELSSDSIIRQVQVDAFFRFKETVAVKHPAHQDMAMKWGKLAVQVSQIVKPKAPPPPKTDLAPLRPLVFTTDFDDTPSLQDIEQPPDDPDPGDKK